MYSQYLFGLFDHWFCHSSFNENDVHIWM